MRAMIAHRRGRLENSAAEEADVERSIRLRQRLRRLSAAVTDPHVSAVVHLDVSRTTTTSFDTSSAGHATSHISCSTDRLLESG